MHASIRSMTQTTNTALPPSMQSTTPTVLLFGTTGSGKSSVINMLPNDPDYPPELAESKLSAEGVTSEIRFYHKLVRGHKFTFLDSMGTGEGKYGTVPTNIAVERLYDYLVEWTTGIHLVMMVMRAGRITAIEESNYILARLLFGDRVPIVLVLTHLEQEEDKDAWWGEQEKGRLRFKKSVGMVATPGRRGMFQELYDESREDIQDLVLGEAKDPEHGFKLERQEWFQDLSEKMDAIVQRAHPQGYSLHQDFLQMLLEFKTPNGLG